MRQAGVEGVVSALHQYPAGEEWSREAIETRQAEIGRFSDGAPSGLTWDVVESLPVSEAIKTQTGDWRAHVESWRNSLGKLADAGIRTVCYNFMPVLDWTRTEFEYRLPHGGTAMRFDAIDFAAFDLFILKRKGAGADLPDEVVDEARRRHSNWSEAECKALFNRLVCGLPGTAKGITAENFRDVLAVYHDISADHLRSNYVAFLEEVVPVAEDLGMRLCCHPDDPPFPLLGLPRIMSTEADYRSILEAVDSPANGVTLCSGSLGARSDNDLPGMMQRLGPKVHFIHLRNVRRESDHLGSTFYEAEHLDGDTDMRSLVAAVLEEEQRRKQEGRADWNIPFRPDHGQKILHDAGFDAQPGYPAIGRLRGLAELRGLIAGLSQG
jgi:mannonate dehydratase